MRPNSFFYFISLVCKYKLTTWILHIFSSHRTLSDCFADVLLVQWSVSPDAASLNTELSSSEPPHSSTIAGTLQESHSTEPEQNSVANPVLKIVERIKSFTLTTPSTSSPNAVAQPRSMFDCLTRSLSILIILRTILLAIPKVIRFVKHWFRLKFYYLNRTICKASTWISARVYSCKPSKEKSLQKRAAQKKE